MNRFPFHPISATLLPLVGAFTLGQSSVMAQSTLHLAYPPNNHQTTANKIFLIGSAPPTGTVLVNGQAIARSTAGHFAPSLPLQLGANQFTLKYGSQQLQLTVTRLPIEPPAPVGATFAPDSLTPAVDLARLPNEPICFSAIAPANATVNVKLADQTIPLEFQPQRTLPPNSAVLTGQNQPAVTSAGKFQGCVRTVLLGDLGKPEFQLTLGDRQNSQVAPGSIQILSPDQLEVAEVMAEAGTARTGPSTDYSRLTPLLKGTQAVITGVEGEWLRLDYGAWIKRSEVQIRKTSVAPTSIIRSVKAKQVGDWTEVVFPLQVPVPVSVQQGDSSFTLTLHNTTAQTDTIKLSDDPLIARLDWQQVAPSQVEYKFNLKTAQQWGYKLRYEGTSLVLSLKHPPKGNRGATTSKTALAGIKILLDPGHGGAEDTGATSPTGYPEKDMTLIMSKLVRDRLVRRGATVVMTRETDIDVPLQDRVNLIQTTQPAIALSLHYNALPDDGDAIKTQGVSAFWYHTQAHSLAVFLHNYLVKTLNRPSDGVFWNNLALTRPANTPSVLLELGFMINPTEFEWIMNAQEQQRLATAIADGITEWVQQAK